MALPPRPISPPVSSLSPSPVPTTPLELSQQLQRVEALHQQLKAETQRAQEFLIKLRRGELEAQTQAQLQLEQRQRERDDAERRMSSEDKDGHGMCTCSCPHHPPAPAFVSPTHAHNHNSFTNDRDPAMPQLSDLPTARVDEREVRDLEKRVRGLEGRVRGFEGLPPDREMALLEVERLRRELEGLARRREGLFENLGGEDGLRLGRSNTNSSNSGKKVAIGNGHATAGEVTAGTPGQRTEHKGVKVAANGAKGTGKGGKRN